MNSADRLNSPRSAQTRLPRNRGTKCLFLSSQASSWEVLLLLWRRQGCDNSLNRPRKQKDSVCSVRKDPTHMLAVSHMLQPWFPSAMWHKCGLRDQRLILQLLIHIRSTADLKVQHISSMHSSDVNRRTQRAVDALMICFLRFVLSLEPTCTEVTCDTFRWLVKISRTSEDLLSNPPISCSERVVHCFTLMIERCTIAVALLWAWLLAAAATRPEPSGLGGERIFRRQAGAANTRSAILRASSVMNDWELIKFSHSLHVIWMQLESGFQPYIKYTGK